MRAAKSATACLLKNEPASLCMPRMAKDDESGAEGKPSVNSAQLPLKRQSGMHKTRSVVSYP